MATVQVRHDRWTVTYRDQKFEGSVDQMAAHMGFMMQDLAALRAEVERLRSTWTPPDDDDEHTTYPED